MYAFVPWAYVSNKRSFIHNRKGKEIAKGWPLTVACKSVANRTVVACTREVAGFIRTQRVCVAASIVDSAFVHIFKSHNTSLRSVVVTVRKKLMCSIIYTDFYLHQDVKQLMLPSIALGHLISGIFFLAFA